MAFANDAKSQLTHNPAHLNRGACKVSCASIHPETEVESRGVAFPDHLDGVQLHEDRHVRGVAYRDHILLPPLNFIWDDYLYTGLERIHLVQSLLQESPG